MKHESCKNFTLRQQREWASRAGKSVDIQGYLESVEANLLQPLSSTAMFGFAAGSGSELLDTVGRPAKIRALHSSAALAVNVFDYWTTRDAAPLAWALGAGCSAPLSAIKSIHFERQYPTGLAGNPPNLDVVLQLESGFTIGIESKFTEWMTPASKGSGAFRPAYFPESGRLWAQRKLPYCQQLAEAITTGREQFQWLNAPQLLKHALGLATSATGRFSLQYLYFDGRGTEADAHRAEIERFTSLVGPELQFASQSYEELISALGNHVGADNLNYITYLRDRY